MMIVNTIFNSLEEYMSTHSNHSVALVQRADTDFYPKVVFAWQLSNNAYNGSIQRDIKERYIFTLDIYAKDAEPYDSIQIAEDIQKNIYDFFVTKCNSKVVFAKPTPNVDESIYRITMRFDMYGIY